MAYVSLKAARYSFTFTRLSLLLSAIFNTYQSGKGLALAHAAFQNDEPVITSNFRTENAYESSGYYDEHSNRLASGADESATKGEREHMRIMRAIYDRLADIEMEMTDGTASTDIDIHALRQEVILPELEYKASLESEVHGLLRALRNTEQFRQAYHDLDDDSLKDDIRNIIGDEGGILGFDNGLAGSSVADEPAQDGQDDAIKPEEVTMFGRRLRNSKMHKRDAQIDDDPTSLCEDKSCTEAVEVIIDTLRSEVIY